MYGQSTNMFTESDTLRYALDPVWPEFQHAETVTLPEPEPLDVSLGTVLEGRRSRRSFTGEGISRQTLSTLLYYGAEVTDRKPYADLQLESGETVVEECRSYPSAGRLYPVESYVVVNTGHESLDAGLYHYSPSEHELKLLREADDSFEEAFGELWLNERWSDSAIAFLLSGVFWRVTSKYGPFGYRLLLENAGAWRRDLREAEYGALDGDRSLLESLSPINSIENLTTPLFVLHGENDPRVPVDEANQIAREARKRDVPVEKLVFEDEGHGISKLENRIEAYTAVVAFLDDHV